MKRKNDRLEAIRLIISGRQIGSQEELLTALRAEGFSLTQATLSRDLKQLKVAKASTMSGKYVYVLPNETMYKRVHTAQSLQEMMKMRGYINLTFSNNIAVMKTREGFASPLAFEIDSLGSEDILGTVAGQDTIIMVLRENVSQEEIKRQLNELATRSGYYV